MAFFKIAIIATLVLLVSSTPILKNSDLHICNEADAKTKILDKVIQRDPNILGVEETVHIPESGVLPKPLTCIIATDLLTDGSEAILESGGLSTYSAIIKLKSKMLHGLKYRIEAWTSE